MREGVVEGTDLHLLLSCIILLPPHVGTVYLASPLFVNFLQSLTNLLQFPLIQCILETPALFILVLKLAQLFLFLFKFRETRLDVVDKFVDLCTFSVSLSHDAERLCTALFVDFGACNFFQKGEALVVFRICKGSDLEDSVRKE